MNSELNRILGLLSLFDKYLKGYPEFNNEIEAFFQALTNELNFAVSVGYDSEELVDYYQIIKKKKAFGIFTDKPLLRSLLADIKRTIKKIANICEQMD